MPNGDGDLAERAKQLRRDGKSRREIRDLLRIRSDRALTKLLDGEPPHPSSRRPRAKDELRRRARELRGTGQSLLEIARELGVAKSSVSLWVRDIPAAPHVQTEKARARAREWWIAERGRRDVMRQQEKLDAAREVGRLTDRELLLIGAAVYWAEGSKAKPWRQDESLQFINSDPRMILLFLRWLELLDVHGDRIRFSVHIHESADIDAALRFWSELVGVPTSEFGKTVIKRHQPRTNRKNIGDDYVGCLLVYVRASAALYRRAEGLFVGITEGSPAAVRWPAGLPALASCLGGR